MTEIGTGAGNGTGTPYSYRIRRWDDMTICGADEKEHPIFPVKVFNPQGVLKKIISATKIRARPMEEAKHAI